MRYSAQDRPKPKPNEPKSFLVLPLIEETAPKMPVKKPDLHLLIKSWPPKRQPKKDRPEAAAENPRPLTATLERPTILDIRFIDKIDMSKIRREFLNISNLCKVPLLMNAKKTALRRHRPLSLPPPEKKKSVEAKKKKKKIVSPKKCWDREETGSTRSPMKAKSCKPNTTLNHHHHHHQSKKPCPPKLCDTNNNNSSNNNVVIASSRTSSVRMARKSGAPSAKLSNVKIEMSNNNDSNKSTKLVAMPEPCKTCGRPDQPERFHSHPPKLKMAEAPPVVKAKSIVQKPIAIKYKSNAERKPSHQEKVSALSRPTARPSPSPTRATVKPSPTLPPPARKGSGKKTLTCYLCGREFGTASLHLHEPKCLQKWEMENAKLPSEQRRRPPAKPDRAASQDQWNDLAWESFQSTLVPCPNCGRTFHPDRLMVHQRSCKPSDKKPNIKPMVHSNTLNVPMSTSPPSSPSSNKPPTYKCYMCGKLFGSNSIKIHEKQCLKKWNSENDSSRTDSSPSPVQKAKSPTSQKSEERPKSSRKPILLPCYLCGKLFTMNSMHIHEPHCLKMWRLENEKLPAHKRRQEPVKPEIQLTEDGKVDFEATSETIWKTHLSQLVPCKVCSRTFNPDRVEVHERSCKGP